MVSKAEPLFAQQVEFDVVKQTTPAEGTSLTPRDPHIFQTINYPAGLNWEALSSGIEDAGFPAAAGRGAGIGAAAEPTATTSLLAAAAGSAKSLNTSADEAM